MNLKDKTVVVTGATGGIGRELVGNLDKEGVRLILVSKTESELQNLLSKLERKENKCYPCDLSNQKETEALAKKISAEAGKVDILINAAGIGIYKAIEETTLDDWNASMNINVSAHFILIKGLAEILKRSENSLVLSIGSGAGVIPMAGRSIYCATKFAVRGLTLSLAEEFRGSNTHFCLITLGSTLTSFGPMSFKEKKKDMESGKAYFTPDWVAKKLVEIMKDDNRDIEYTLYPADYGLGRWEKPR